jgi:hypothetical protein
MTRSKDTAGLAVLEQAFEDGADRRPPVYRWLWAHHDEFAAMLDGRRPDWARLAEAFAQMGIANANGSPLQPRTLRVYWLRVRGDYARHLEEQARRARQAKLRAEGPDPLPASAETPAAATVQSRGPTAPVGTDEAILPPRPSVPVIEPIRPVTLKPSPPSDPPAAATRPAIPRRPDPPPPTPEEVQERLRQLDEQLRARSNRMPEPIYDVGDPRGKKSAGK